MLNHTPTPQTYTLSLHDALPISLALRGSCITIRKFAKIPLTLENLINFGALTEQMMHFLIRSVIAKKNILISGGTDRKSTRLNSSHVETSYAVFCLKKQTSNTSC